MKTIIRNTIIAAFIGLVGAAGYMDYLVSQDQQARVQYQIAEEIFGK